MNKELFLRIEELTLGLNESERVLHAKIQEILQVESFSFQIVKKAIDSRNKREIKLIYSVDVRVSEPQAVTAGVSENLRIRHRVRVVEEFVYVVKGAKGVVGDFGGSGKIKRPVVVGSGPAGIFAGLLLAKAGLKPLIVERGKDVDERVKDVDHFKASGELNTESNIQFGEGGAGTFSDGKLYTLINDPRSKFIFEELVKAGAPSEILIDAQPHIGTDRLRQVVRNLRQEIVSLGGEVRFGTKMTDIDVPEGKISAVILNGAERIEVDDLVIAIGHSARDTYEMFHEKGLTMEAKPFAIGVRIEHKAEMINRAQYGSFHDHPKLGPARYKLVAHLPGARSVYTFCMCPGGYVMASSSEDGGVVVNGMSEYARDGENSNSALLVGVLPEDFGTDHPLAGVEFQRVWERKAFGLSGGSYKAPAQLVGDFLNNTTSSVIKSIKPTYKPGIFLGSIASCLPDFVVDSLRQALPELDRKIHGFAHPEAVLTGPETRSSSPVRIVRDDIFQSNIRGIYPAGEGAGYAGGITSSAIDGLRIAESIIDKMLKNDD